MARPVKNYCDYFTHDRDMRNHRKVKALRNKFGVTGYAIWAMLLEYLTGADGNEFEHSDHELELISGDFGIPVTEIRDVLNYCIKLEMLFEKKGFIHSESLDERLSVVYEKRKVAKSLSKKQYRNNGKYAANNTDATVVSVTETPQSKVKQSKEDNIIVINEKNDFSDSMWVSHKNSFIKDGQWAFKFCSEKNLKLDEFDKLVSQFIADIELKEDYKTTKELKSHFTNLFNKKSKEKKIIGSLNNPHQDSIEEARRNFKPIIEP